MPRTRHPFAFSIWIVIKPISPKPKTTIVSPIVGFKRRTPCKPIDARTVKAADSSSTSSGIFAHRLLGTLTI